MRISDWSSDVCSSDLRTASLAARDSIRSARLSRASARRGSDVGGAGAGVLADSAVALTSLSSSARNNAANNSCRTSLIPGMARLASCTLARSEEHTSELQSLMRISYAVFCLKKKNQKHDTHY